MKILIKAKNFELDENLRSYLEEKLRKYEKVVQEPAVCEVRLEEKGGAKKGIDKLVHLYLTLPKMKNPIHLMEQTDDWFGSIDLIEDKLASEFIKYKEKYLIGSRYPKKYHAAELEEEAEDEL